MAGTVVRARALSRNTLMFCAFEDDTMAWFVSLEFCPKDPARSR